MIAIAIEGMIVIDKLDTSFVLRQDFRFKITNISQAPVLFPATIRYNLDLFNIYSYTELWGALEWVELKSAIPSLDYKIAEGGSNFSVGQRQLICLARALLI
ncbi:ATP-binding cassette subfamily C member 4-like isoform X1 [Plodia interpunctella]|uniref:ATP-binding cassette subfamily C member 4-like isoform X1 n=1 Tax=Plodia interpunctella TaxID=58824 RepID=UPI0031012E8C